jgi:hypothetical protein
LWILVAAIDHDPWHTYIRSGDEEGDGQGPLGAATAGAAFHEHQHGAARSHAESRDHVVPVVTVIGKLTPTMKLKSQAIVAKYVEIIDRMDPGQPNA